MELENYQCRRLMLVFIFMAGGTRPEVKLQYSITNQRNKNNWMKKEKPHLQQSLPCLSFAFYLLRFDREILFSPFHPTTANHNRQPQSRTTNHQLAIVWPFVPTFARRVFNYSSHCAASSMMIAFSHTYFRGANHLVCWLLFLGLSSPHPFCLPTTNDRAAAFRSISKITLEVS